MLEKGGGKENDFELCLQHAINNSLAGVASKENSFEFFNKKDKQFTGAKKTLTWDE